MNIIFRTWGPKPILVFLSSLLFLIPLNLGAHVVRDVSPGDESVASVGTLDALVEEFIRTASPERAQKLLGGIQTHSGADIESITKILQQPRRYAVEPLGAQPSRPVMVRGLMRDYALYVPEQYRPKRAYPLIICLHGAGFTGESYLDRWVPRLEEKYILACPSVAMGTWWTRYGEELVLRVIQDVRLRYHVDPDRIFLTGMSNGGIGAWLIGMHYADRFAGIAPMASGLDTVLFPFLENLVNTPVYVIHGAEDTVMPVQLSRDLVKEMERKGVPYLYREHHWTHPHAGGHFFPRQELPDLIAWFDRQTRESLPRRVSLVRDASHLTPFHWVRIDTTEQIAALTEDLIDNRDEYMAGAIYAKLHADITVSNTIVVSTNRIQRYTLFVNSDLVDFSKPLFVETNGRKSFEGRVEPSMETLLQEVRQRSDTQVLYPAKLTIDLP